MKPADIIVFGAGSGGKNVIEALGRENVRFAVDNDSRKWRSFVAGIPVYPPDEIAPEGSEQIIVASVYAADIYQQLLDLGIAADKIRVASAEMMSGELVPSRRCLLALSAVVLAVTLAVLAGTP